MSIGSFIFNFFGASVRWAWGQIRYPIFGGEKFTFSEYLNGPEKSDDEIIDGYGHQLINNVVGFIFIMIALFLSAKYFA